MATQSETPADSESSNKIGRVSPADRLERKPALGEMIWVKLPTASWWPAQVVDDKGVRETIKPRNKPKGSVLVRLYGSYTYWYVDPIEWQSEFKTVLEQHNGSHQKVFKNALEQELKHVKCGRSKGQGSRSTGSSNGTGNISGKNKITQNKASRHDAALCGRSPERRVKVMQALGLIAPFGSPFQKNG